MGRCGSGGVGKFVRRTGLARNSAPPGLVHLPCHRRAAAWPFPGRSFFTRISRFGHVRRLPRRLASTVLEGALEFVHDDMTTRGKLRRQGPQRRKRRPAHGGAHQVAEAHNDRVTCSSGRFAPRRQRRGSQRPRETIARAEFQPHDQLSHGRWRDILQPTNFRCVSNDVCADAPSNTFATEENAHTPRQS
jgi:hypothetical protein